MGSLHGQLLPGLSLAWCTAVGAVYVHLCEGMAAHQHTNPPPRTRSAVELVVACEEHVQRLFLVVLAEEPAPGLSEVRGM